MSKQKFMNMYLNHYEAEQKKSCWFTNIGIFVRICVLYKWEVNFLAHVH